MSTIFLNYFESELLYGDEPSIKNVSFVGARKKCDIFKISEQSLYRDTVILNIKGEVLEWRSNLKKLNTPKLNLILLTI